MRRRVSLALLGGVALTAFLAAWWGQAARVKTGGNEGLKQALQQLEGAWETVPEGQDVTLDKLRQQVRSEQVLAGNTEMTGAGLRVMLSDAPRSALALPGSNPNWMLVHDNDLLRLINALRAGGAPALAVSGVRLTATTAVRCGGPSIQVGGNHLTPPFVVEAIGDPEVLYQALMAGQPSLYQEFSAYGLGLTIERTENLTLPMAPARQVKFARVGEVAGS